MSSPSELASLDLAAAAILLAATVIGMLMLGALAAFVIRPWLGEWFAAVGDRATPASAHQPARATTATKHPFACTFTVGPSADREADDPPAQRTGGSRAPRRCDVCRRPHRGERQG